LIGLEKEAGLDIFTFSFQKKVGIILCKEFYSLSTDLIVLTGNVYPGKEETGGSQ
jgi:hypothetical protein